MALRLRSCLCLCGFSLAAGGGLQRNHHCLLSLVAKALIKYDYGCIAEISAGVDHGNMGWTLVAFC